MTKSSQYNDQTCTKNADANQLQHISMQICTCRQQHQRNDAQQQAKRVRNEFGFFSTGE